MTLLELVLVGLLTAQSLAWIAVDVSHYSRELDISEGNS